MGIIIGMFIGSLVGGLLSILFVIGCYEFYDKYIA